MDLLHDTQTLNLSGNVDSLFLIEIRDRATQLSQATDLVTRMVSTKSGLGITVHRTMRPV